MEFDQDFHDELLNKIGNGKDSVKRTKTFRSSMTSFKE